jgi:uncharacterized OB-fold protein
MPKKKIKPRKCENPDCGQTFIPSREWQKYCKSACGTAVRQKAFIDRRIKEAIAASASE